MNNMKPVIEEGIYQVLDLSTQQIENVIAYFESLDISAEFDPTYGEIYFYQERLGDIGEILGDINSVQIKMLDNDPDDSIVVNKAELSTQERLFDNVKQEVFVIYSEGQFVAPLTLEEAEPEKSEKDLLLEALSEFIDYLENDFFKNLDEKEVKECTCDESHITEPVDDEDDTISFSDFEKNFFESEEEDDDDDGWEILLGNPEDAFSFINSLSSIPKVEVTITNPKDKPLTDDVLALLDSLGFCFD